MTSGIVIPHVPTSITILICTRNRSESLRKTLLAIEECEVPVSATGGVEILVVDNGSTDDTAQVASDHITAKYTIRYLFEPVRGKSNAYNAGVNAARGEVIISTDDDVIPSASWLIEHIQPYTEVNVALVQGRVILDFGENSPPEWLGPLHRQFLAETAFGDAPICPFEGGFIGANMSFRKSAIPSENPFEPLLGPGRAGFGEEEHFAEAIMRSGFVGYYNHLASVKHVISPERLDPKYFTDTALRMGRSLSFRLAIGEHQDATRFNAITVTRAYVGAWRSKMRCAFTREAWYGSADHLRFLVYIGFARANLLGFDRLRKSLED